MGAHRCHEPLYGRRKTHKQGMNTHVDSPLKPISLQHTASHNQSAYCAQQKSMPRTMHTVLHGQSGSQAPRTFACAVPQPACRCVEHVWLTHWTLGIYKMEMNSDRSPQKLTHHGPGFHRRNSPFLSTFAPATGSVCTRHPPPEDKKCLCLFA